MLGSGYFRGSSVLITGSAGTGKSILARAVLKLRVCARNVLFTSALTKIRPKSCATFPQWEFALARR